MTYNKIDIPTENTIGIVLVILFDNVLSKKINKVKSWFGK